MAPSVESAREVQRGWMLLEGGPASVEEVAASVEEVAVLVEEVAGVVEDVASQPA